MIKYKLYIIFCFLLIILSKVVTAQNQIVYKDEQKIIEIGQSIYFLDDKEDILTIKDILKSEIQNKFTKNVNNPFNTNEEVKSIWIKFDLQNQTGKELFIKLENVDIPEIEIYIPQTKPDSFQVKKMGINYPYGNKEILSSSFITSLSNGKDSLVHTFYIHIRQVLHHEIPFSIGLIQNLLQSDIYNHIFFGIFFGVLFIMFLYTSFIYPIIKDVSYLYYASHTFASILFSLGLSGYGVLFVWDKYPILNIDILFFAHLTMMASLIPFSTSLLQSKKYTPVWHKGFKFFLLSIGLIGIGSFFNISFWLNISLILFVILFVYILIVAIRSYTKGNKSAYFYIIGNTFYLGGIMITILRFDKIISVNFFTLNANYFGTLIEIFLFSFALADRIKLITKNNEEIQGRNFDLIKGQKEILEKEVKRRTNELEERSQEIEAQNEELYQQKEELVITNEHLEEKNKVINTQNGELSKSKKAIESLKNSLEDIVKQRTNELYKALDNLTKQNQDLAQFSYIISHNIRSPIARILGLVNIFNEEDYNHSFNKEIISHLKKTTTDLDIVIKDLTQIISIRNDLNKTKEEIDILETIELEKFLLQDEIKRSNATIKIELNNINKLFSTKSYFQSIIHNLLSNAIKYKADKRNLIINISVEIVSKFICLSIQDNGLGIDMEKTDAYKIFGLYQRMHDHVEGKGLGLFLVKTQIESLGGKVELGSELDMGSTFRVYFPK